MSANFRSMVPHRSILSHFLENKRKHRLFLVENKYESAISDAEVMKTSGRDSTSHSRGALAIRRWRDRKKRENPVFRLLFGRKNWTLMWK